MRRYHRGHYSLPKVPIPANWASPPRGLAAGELRTQLTVKSASLPDAIKDLKIKISGCFNSCGQHHVSDIGFFGNAAAPATSRCPISHPGRQMATAAGSYGLAGAVPSKTVPEVVDTITSRHVEERQRAKPRSGLDASARRKLAAYSALYAVAALNSNPNSSPTGETPPSAWAISASVNVPARSFHSSLWRFSILNRKPSKAQIALDENDPARADNLAYSSMLKAARALVRTQFLDVGDSPDRIVEFKTRFFDTELFFDQYAKGKFGQYLLDRHSNPKSSPTMIPPTD